MTRGARFAPSNSVEQARSSVEIFMAKHSEKASPTPAPGKEDKNSGKRRRRWGRRLLILGVGLFILLAIARVMAPSFLREYVNGVIDRSPLYDGEIGPIEIDLWRGAYTINDIRINKVTGNVPAPLFAARKLDLSIEWGALTEGSVVGRVVMDKPELNFVDSESESADQTGVGGPWLDMLQDLFPFRINSCEINEGSIHFRAIDKETPVDVYIDELEAMISNLTNIRDETTPLVSNVEATGMAMGHAKFEYEMKLNPFSYYPTFDLVVRLIGLNVTEVNDLSRAYGAFDFENGYFDLVIELDCTEGQLEGYVKPLFRDLTIMRLDPDASEGNILQVFWEALVGATTELLENQPKNQFATQIPVRGDLTRPQTELLTVLGNVLRNAFIRAYMPTIQGNVADVGILNFGRGSIVAPPVAETD